MKIEENKVERTHNVYLSEQLNYINKLMIRWVSCYRVEIFGL